MADRTFKPIAEIRVGDEVMAIDPETGKRGPRKVIHVWVHNDQLRQLVLDDGAIVTTTEDHPYWNATEHQWQRADALSGDNLLGPEGQHPRVHGIRLGPALPAPAYTLTIDDIHTYYVLAGNTPVLVHNCPSAVGERGPWRLTKEGSTGMKRGGPFNTTFYKSASDGTWWTKDVKGDGGSAFKVYRETNKGLEWIADADQYGDYFTNKWKSDTGKFIPWSQLRGAG